MRINYYNESENKNYKLVILSIKNRKRQINHHLDQLSTIKSNRPENLKKVIEYWKEKINQLEIDMQKLENNHKEVSILQWPTSQEEAIAEPFITLRTDKTITLNPNDEIFAGHQKKSKNDIPKRIFYVVQKVISEKTSKTMQNKKLIVAQITRELRDNHLKTKNHANTNTYY